MSTTQKFLQDGSSLFVTNFEGMYEKLPVGVYSLTYNMEKGYYLRKRPDFELPKKIYGDVSIVDRWLASWEHNTEKNLGIFLSGMKGTGKTITAELLCVKSKLPVILIQEKFKDTGFLNFLTSSVFDKCVVFIDEYDKIYEGGRDENVEILQLLDGANSGGKIFVLTANSTNINFYLENRLNRIKYHKHYSSLSGDVVEEVIEDMLINKEHKQSVHDFFDAVGICTFDLLVNLIREMNLFGENAVECAKHLNISENPVNYQVREIVMVNGERKEFQCYELNNFTFNSRKTITINRSYGQNNPNYYENDNGDEVGEETYTFDKDTASIKRSYGKIELTSPEGVKVILTQQPTFRRMIF